MNSISDRFESEVVFAVVAPIGTDLDRFVQAMESRLREYRYEMREVRLSHLVSDYLAESDLHIEEWGTSSAPNESAEFARVSRLMTLGNNLRREFSSSAMAALGIAKIASGRALIQGSAQPAGRVAHLIVSLKHPEEVKLLRRIYGPGFYLIGLGASQDDRRKHLIQRGCTEEEAAILLDRDTHEDLEAGQRTRDTFHLADVFLTPDGSGLERFLKLVFGYPYESPTRDEHAMFLAFSAALRSADLSRQVGAAILSRAGDLVAIGANEVPRSGGGLYWNLDYPDCRDWAKGHDSNQIEKERIVNQLVTILSEIAGNVSEDQNIELRARLDTTSLMDITEYGRPVHAEMEALLSCGRSGISTREGTLYCTTYPCHNCMKHIIAAGIRRVVFVEPYPKSKAVLLYGDELDDGSGSDPRTSPKVLVQPFQGIGPRRFMDLFSMGMGAGFKIKRKEKDGKVRPWDQKSASLRVLLVPNSYLALEEEAWADFAKLQPMKKAESEVH